MGAIWSLIPNRLLDEEQFLDLEEGSTCLLLQMYVLCDGYGLAPAGVRWLARRTNCIDPEKALSQLSRCGFLILYENAGRQFASLTHYESDIPASFARKSGKPKYEPPPWPGAWDALGADQGQTKGALRADQGHLIEREKRKKRKKEREKDPNPVPTLMHGEIT